MKRTYIVLILIMSMMGTQAQYNNLMVLKRKDGRNIKTWTTDSKIQFIHQLGNEVNGVVKQVKKDSVWVEQYDIRKVYSAWGTLAGTDTLHRYTIPYSFADLKTFPRKENIHTYKLIPTIIMAAGAGYIVLNGVNSLYNKDAFIDDSNKGAMITAAVAAVGGFLLRKGIQSDYYTVGKNASLSMIDVESK